MSHYRPWYTESTLLSHSHSFWGPPECKSHDSVGDFCLIIRAILISGPRLGRASHTFSLFHHIRELDGRDNETRGWEEEQDQRDDVTRENDAKDAVGEDVGSTSPYGPREYIRSQREKRNRESHGERRR